MADIKRASRAPESSILRETLLKEMHNHCSIYHVVAIVSIPIPDSNQTLHYFHADYLELCSASSRDNGAVARPIPFPDIDALPRPETLFGETPPYHIIIVASRRGITIQGSHSKSLELIAAYFKKWSRKMENDVRRDVR